MATYLTLLASAFKIALCMAYIHKVHFCLHYAGFGNVGELYRCFEIQRPVHDLESLQMFYIRQTVWKHAYVMLENGVKTKVTCVHF